MLFSAVILSILFITIWSVLLHGLRISQWLITLFSCFLPRLLPALSSFLFVPSCQRSLSNGWLVVLGRALMIGPRMSALSCTSCPLNSEMGSGWYLHGLSWARTCPSPSSHSRNAGILGMCNYCHGQKECISQGEDCGSGWFSMKGLSVTPVLALMVHSYCTCRLPHLGLVSCWEAQQYKPYVKWLPGF